jgi:secreted trypsin-like serine protease
VASWLLKPSRMLRLAAPFFISLLSLSVATIGGGAPAHANPVSAPIVGGTPVAAGAWPDVVAVIGRFGICTGTVIAEDLVLTAAHCLDIAPYEVVAGQIDLRWPGGERRAIEWARAYPDWEERYDIAVLMLTQPLRAAPRAVAQACTARDRLVTGTPLQLVGFGLTTKSGTGTNTRLHEATVAVIDGTCTTDPACAAAVAPGGEFTAGGHGTDACYGDSGGPVYIATAHGPALVGVVSRGLADTVYPCGEGGVYVRADKVVAWIQRVSGRKLARVPCDRPADEDPAHEATGCAAGGGRGGAGLALVCALAGLIQRRRRQATADGA